MPTPSGPGIVRGVFLAIWGAAFLGIGAYDIKHGSFRYGHYSSVVITPDSHPVFFLELAFFYVWVRNRGAVAGLRRFSLCFTPSCPPRKPAPKSEGSPLVNFPSVPVSRLGPHLSARLCLGGWRNVPMQHRT